MFLWLAFAVLAPAAQAAPTISLTAGGQTGVLLGGQETVTLKASSAVGQPQGYNLSFRDVIPSNVSYVPGSASIGGISVTPRILPGAPTAGSTTLLFENVADLSGGSSQTLTFKVTPSTGSAVGSTYTHQASAQVNSNPRKTPKYDPVTGVPLAPSYTGSASATKTTTINAIDVTQDEPSSEGEILRGAHDHQSVFSFTLANNGVATTDLLHADVYLPEGLEFLGCGNVDNTTESSTNPGFAEEFEGSGPLSGHTAAPANCLTPSYVETVSVDPDGAGSMPAGVYTHVHYETIPQLGAGASTTIRYVAAVPIRNNTVAPFATSPTPNSGLQAANLDNNTGTETADEQALPTYVAATGRYTATSSATAASNHMDRTAEDVKIVKSSPTTTFGAGQITRWTLDISTSEYRNTSDLRVTDTLPDGYCPLAATNLEGTAECAGGAGDVPSFPFASTTENSNGSWTLAWDSSTDPALANFAPSTTHSISFSGKVRRFYQENGNDETRPVLARDSLTNSVSLAGADSARCGSADPTCASVFSTEIFHTEPDGIDDTDSSEFTQTSDAPTIDKTVRTAGGAVPANCSGGSYVDNTASAYGPSDRVCFKLRVDFNSNLQIQNANVTDFLPPGLQYESYTPTASNDVGVATSAVAGDDTVAFDLGTGGYVSEGSTFEVLLAARIVDPTAGNSGDVKGNLMKFSGADSTGATYPLRDSSNFNYEEASLSLTEGVGSIGATNFGANQDNKQVQAGDNVGIRVDLTNGGARAATNTTVREVLPSNISCADIVGGSIDNGGSCSAGVITWTGVGVPGSGTTKLTYHYIVPSGTVAKTNFAHAASVQSYESPDNAGGATLYTPGVNAPAANDVTNVFTASPTVASSITSAVNETGNNGTNQATIGERVNWKYTVTIPQGTTLSSGTSFTVPGSTRQTVIPGSIGGTLNAGALPPGITITPSGDGFVVNFTSDYANANGSGDDTLALTFSGYIDDEAANNKGAGSSLPMPGTLSYVDGGGTTQTPGTTPTASIVEPSITLAKDENDPDDRVIPGQILTYTLTLANPSETRVSAAHNSQIVDTLPIGVTPLDASDNPVVDGAGVDPDGGIWNASAHTITFTRTAGLDPGASANFRYRVRINDPQPANANLDNSAVATTTSHPEGTTHGAERVSPSTGYRATASDTVSLTNIALAKSVSDPSATIGQSEIYNLDVTIPGGVTAYDVTVRDSLPDGLAYDGFIDATCTAGCPPAVPATTALPAEPQGNGSTTLGFFIGDVAAAPAGQPRTVRIRYRAHVEDQRQDTSRVVAGNVLTNTAIAYSNRADVIVGTPSTIPPPTFTDASTDGGVPPGAAPVSVVEPALSIDKDVAGQAGDSDVRGAQAGTTLSYSVTVTNNGNSAANDVVISDQPSAKLTDVTLAAGNSTTYNTDGWTSADPDLQWTVPTIAANSSITFTYTAKLLDPQFLSHGDHAINTADVDVYYGRPAAERIANPLIDYRSYTSTPSDTVDVTLALPTMSVTNTTNSGAESANARINQDFVWRGTLTNTSLTADADSVDLTYVLPKNWVYVSSAGAALGGVTPTITTVGGVQTLTFTNVGDFPPGAARAYAITAKPTPAAQDDPGGGAGNPHISTASTVFKDATGASGAADGPYQAGPDNAQAILQLPDLAVTKTPDSGAANAGENVTWTVRIQNNGNAPATDVAVSDTLPAGVTYTAGAATASPTTGFSETDGTGPSLGWSIASIPVGGAVDVSVPVKTDSSLATGTTLTNTAMATAIEQTTPASDSGSFGLGTEADMSIVKSASVPRAVAGGASFDYSLDVTNNGPSDAHNVRVSDVLPSEVDFVSIDPGSAGTCTEATGSVDCNLGTVTAGTTTTLKFKVRVPEGETATSVANTAAVTTDTTDSTPGNDSSTATTPLDQQTDVSISKTAPPNAAQNQQFTYTLRAENAGPSTAHGVAITDVLPAGIVVDNVGPGCVEVAGTVTCAIGDMLAGANTTRTVTVHGTAVGTVANTATITTTSPDGDPSNDDSTANIDIGPTAALSITKTGDARIAADGVATYTLSATNAGPSPAANAVISDELPAGLTYVDSSSTDATCTVQGQHVSCPLSAPLASGATATVTIRARAGFAVSGTSIVNRGTVTSDGYDPDLSDNAATAPSTVGPSVDLTLSKVGPTRAASNGVASYVLDVSNRGRQTATGVTLTDNLPAGMTPTNADSTNGDCAIAGQQVKCAIGSLAAGASARVTVDAAVSRGMIGRRLTNTASVTDDQPDAVPATNVDSATTQVITPSDTAGGRLLVTKQASKKRVALGKAVAFKITVRNQSASTETHVKVLDLPATKARLISIKPSKGHCKGLRCDIGTLAPGASATVRVVMEPLKTGTFYNDATAISDQGDNDRAGRNDRAHTKVVAVKTALSLTKRAAHRTVRAGATMWFTLRARNRGRYAAAKVRLCDSLPSGMSFVSARGARFSGGRACWRVDLLRAGQTMARRVKVRIARTAGGRMVNRAGVAASNAHSRSARAGVDARRVAGAQRGDGVTG